MKYIIASFMTICFMQSFSQKAAITFETNGKHAVNRSENPFQDFIGEWTLENDRWIQNWGGATDTITIPKHHTVSSQVNTSNSLFSIIDGPEPNGHIFWSYNPNTKEVYHLSSFGTLRSGVGKGEVLKSGDITLKITFEGEPKDTYRIYQYKWITDDKYHMRSVQYTLDDNPTGLFYEGVFIRLGEEDMALESKIRDVLAVLDNNRISIEEQLKVYADNIVHMAPDHEANVGKNMLGNYLREQKQYGEVKMQHEIVAFEVLEDTVIMRGSVTGTYYPKNNTPVIEFKTKNLFVFSLNEGGLKIKKVIYNSSPIE